MAVNLAVLQQTISKLRYTTALSFDGSDIDAMLFAQQHYVPRQDQLAQKIVQRVVAPAAPMLLVAGPMGCGKSTELGRLPGLLVPSLTVWCPCDQDLDLYELDDVTLMQYVLWRTLRAAERQKYALSSEIARDVNAILPINNSLALPEFRTHSARRADQIASAQLIATAARLVAEIKQIASSNATGLLVLQALVGSGRPLSPHPVVVVDGLEKTPTPRLDVVRRFLRSTFLDGCQSVVVVPSWAVHGENSLWSYPNVDVFDIPVSEDPAFVAQVITTRAGNAIVPDAIAAIARLSGGLVRDGLQIATRACRAAADAGVVPVQVEHVLQAKAALVAAYGAMFSDDPKLARTFLREVRATGQLPGYPAMRDRMLSSSAILPRGDGSYRVHPLLSDPAYEDVGTVSRS